ncbi:MAG: universal stress protein UspA [Firmicutes bacterium]|nr:universal stress protein UspA [Bacillota bacterium]
MEKLPKYLVAYDGSSHSKAALDWAIMLGCVTGAEIEAVKVFEPIVRHYTSGDYNITTRIAEQFDEMEKADQQMMEEAKLFKKNTCDVAVKTKILKGPVAATLLEYAEKNGFDMIVAGTKGHGLLEEIIVGSVTSSLVALAKAPVMVVTDQREAAALKKIIVAYDGSSYAKKALELAIDIGKKAGACLVVAKVLDPVELAMIYSKVQPGSEIKIGTYLIEQDEANKKILDDAKAMGASKGVDVESILLAGGNIAEAIVHYTENEKADIIVAGTLGKGLLDELLVGSVAKNLVTLAQMPVIVAK